MPPNPDPRYVQYGCAYVAPDQWLNFDSSPTLLAERIPVFGRFVAKNAVRFPRNARYGNIVRGLPITENSCVAVFASHVLEHLALRDAQIALANTVRMLQPGGIFRVVVPDLNAYVQKYISNTSAEASHEFMRSTMLGKEVGGSKWMGPIVHALGGSAHLWMWDGPALKSALFKAGFSEVRECDYHDSSDPMFDLVEVRERFVDAVAFECRR